MKPEKEHLTEREVARFQQRAMTFEERRRMDTHVALCEACMERILESSHAHLAFTSLSEAFMPSADEKPFHLSREQLKSYQNEDVDEADRTIFESHLEVCSECNREADNLQTAAELVPVMSRSHGQVESATKSGWLSALRRPFQLWTPAHAVAVITVFGCGLLILALLLQKTLAPAHDQAVRMEQRDGSDPARGATQATNPPAPQPTAEVASGPESAPVEANPGSSSPAVLRLKDGDAEVSLDTQGNLNGLETLSPQTRKAVQTALASEHLAEPRVLAELSGPKINLMGGAADGLPFNLITPVRVVISNNRPTLRWQPLTGATSYVVSIFDADFNLVAKSGSQSATAWSVPVSLQNGRVYSWEVTALKENREITAPVAPAPRAQFKVLEAEKINEISSARKHHPPSHLTLGVLYARAGLLTEAEREFRELVKDNPQSNVAKKLLSTVRSWRSR